MVEKQGQKDYSKDSSILVFSNIFIKLRFTIENWYYRIEVSAVHDALSSFIFNFVLYLFIGVYEN